MTGKSQSRKAQSVLVVEADILDRMNETNASIAQRAYEIYESRGGGHGSDQDDWFTAEQEVLHPLAIERYVTDSALRLTAQVPGFAAKDLEVAIGHRRAVICGVHLDPSQPAETGRKAQKSCGLSSSPLMSIRYWLGQHSKAESCRSYCRAHGKRVLPDSKRATSCSTS